MPPAPCFATIGGPVRTRPSPLDLSTTAEYHDSLRDQRRQHDVEHPLDHHHSRDGTLPKSTARRWIPTRPKTSDSSRRAAGKRDLIVNQPPQLSRQQVEEFETLPIAVRRKYFSALERLRFAQTSGVLDDSSTTADYNHSPRSFTFPNDKPSQNHSLKHPALINQSQTSVYHTDSNSTDCLTANSGQRQLTRQEQVALIRNLRKSVILDAADEAIYKIGYRASRHLSPKPQVHRPALPSPRPSTASHESRMTDAKPQKRQGMDDFYDSFRWIDGDDDLDLSLQLDDHHANYKQELPNHLKDDRPSFRRHLSMTKIPFGRSSISVNRPGTHGGVPAPMSPPPTSATHPPHSRRKSRALSLINTSRHVSQGSTASIDPSAAHYQDPEARAKLRVYLASPQKFDEAVEFGFPSSDAVLARSSQKSRTSGRHSRQVLSQESLAFKTFFSDDRSSTYSDDISLPEPESPRTPHSSDKAAMQQDRLTGSEIAPIRKISDSYAQLPASLREMTLRMTLTRPDLRACEDQIYGWQSGPVQQTSKPAHPAPNPEESLPPKTIVGESNKPKESLEAFFASLDEEEAETAADSGGFKRFWNKVRRN